ncbi:hypothetical protein M9H77_29776 [Catharanthus roseus]|uniref:Uncharacterized protein n=1 Tax=Catharanthus roseus TaxID=4058 RepID=A0ACB9ZXB8_CATRO|nr:hypothetical protein M9H77_29776 [Catharanthus roseus]
MEAIGSQEIAYSKLARARSKCYKDKDYDENDCENYLNICSMGLSFSLWRYLLKCYSKGLLILIGFKFSNAFLIENNLAFQFYDFHLKESMFLLIFENKMKYGFGVFKVCHGVFVKTILRKDFVELLLKIFVKKNLCYFKFFIEIIWKDNSFVFSMKHESSVTLLYYLPFKEFLKKFECEEEFGKSWDSINKQPYTFFDEFLDFMSKSSWEKGLANLVFDNLFIFSLIIGLYDESFQRRGRWYTWERLENMESFQGSITRSKVRSIDLEMQRNKLRRVLGFKKPYLLSTLPSPVGYRRPYRHQ